MGNPLTIGSLFVAIADLICQPKKFSNQGSRTGTGYTGIGSTHFKIALFYCVYIFLTKLMLLRVYLMVHTCIVFFLRYFLLTLSVFRPTSLGED
jgi:hypothetical protein